MNGSISGAGFIALPPQAIAGQNARRYGKRLLMATAALGIARGIGRTNEDRTAGFRCRAARRSGLARRDYLGWATICGKPKERRGAPKSERHKPPIISEAFTRLPCRDRGRRWHLWLRLVGRSDQGNRVKISRGNEACEEVVIPPGGLPPAAQRLLAGRPFQQVEGHVLDGGEVGWRMIGSDATLIVAKDHVHDPVQAVLDGPVAAYDRPQEMRQHHQRGDVIPAALKIDSVLGIPESA